MQSVLHNKIVVVFFLTTLLFSASSEAWQTDAYFVNRIWTGDGEPIQDGVLIIADGKISDVGPRDSVQVPPGATRHELGNCVVIPGLVIAETNLSGKKDVDETITPQINAIDEFDFFADRTIPLSGGVTTVQISPGQNRLMPGMGAVIKLAGADRDSRILDKQESLRVVLDKSSRNPPTIYKPPVGPVSDDRPLTPTQPQLSKSLAGSLAGLRLLFRNSTSTSRFVGTEQDEIVDLVAAYLSKNRTVRFTAVKTPEVRGALSLANTFDLKALLVGCEGLEPFEDSFEGWRNRVRGIVLVGEVPGKITNPTVDDAKRRVSPWKFARELIDAGIPIAVRAAEDGDLDEMLFVAGQFMQDNLSQADALNLLTSWPAKMLGVDDRVGSFQFTEVGDNLNLSF